MYEAFVPPESVPPESPAATSVRNAPPDETGPPATAERGEDPTTEELLRTLPGGPPASTRARRPPPAALSAPAPEPASLPRPAGDDAGAEEAVAESADSGLAPVTTADRPPEPASGAERSAGSYALQVGAFTDATAAGRRAEEARALAAGLPVEIVRLDGWLKVFLGSFATREDAEVTLRDLAARGLGPAWVTRRVP